MLDAVTYPLRAVPAPALPVAKMVLGKPVEEAAALLPCLFNLCREAQGIAARAVFGLPLGEGWQAALRAEVLREHVVKLCLKWPDLLSMPAVPLPRNWQVNADALRAAVFGASGEMPNDISVLPRAGDAVNPILRAIADRFAPGEAVRNTLPAAGLVDMFEGRPLENSVAARHLAHPVMQSIEARWGRGPLWSAVAVLIDIDAVLRGNLPPLQITEGEALVPAARGLYGVRASVKNGAVTAFERVTPTNHLLAPGGAMDQSLATLPARKAQAVAPLLLSLLDPCFPVTLSGAKESANA